MHFSVVSAILFAASAFEYSRPEAPMVYVRPSVSTLPEYTETAAAEPTTNDDYTEPAAEPITNADYTETVSAEHPRIYAGGLILDNGSSDDAFSISDIILTPSIPVPGQELDIHLVGKLKQLIDKGSKVGIKIGHNGDSVVNIELDACGLAKDRKLTHQCPAQPEDFNVHHTIKVPGAVPKGDYSINAYGFSQENVRIFNVSFFYNSPGVAYQ